MNKNAMMNRQDLRGCGLPRGYTLGHVIVHNVPYVLMVLLGASVLVLGLQGSAWAWTTGASYGFYGVAGALWIMFFVCPYCRYYDTQHCPCGYGRIAVKVRSRRDGHRFAEKFRKHIPVIVPLWVVPLLAGVGCAVWQFNWPLLAVLAVFVIDAFFVLPLVARKYGCAHCPQADSCPWMSAGSKAAPMAEG